MGVATHVRKTINSNWSAPAAAVEMVRHSGGPSCFERVKYGAAIGFAVGISTGAIFGTVAGIRYGLRGRELLSQLGKVMLQTGGTFGVFMGVGSAIRC